jgi:hypothetical protein
MPWLDFWVGVFRDTVEGKPGPFSVELTENYRVLNQPIPTGAKPQPELVLALLRSQIPLSPALRSIIADMIDPGADSAFCFKKFGRRKRGRHPPWAHWHMEAALYVEEHFVKKGMYESAVRRAMAQFNLSRSQATKAYSDLREARKIQQELDYQEGGQSS